MMLPMRFPRTQACFLGFCLLILATTPTAAHAAAPDERLARERVEHSLALHAKLLCSGIFVIGREADEFIRNDLQREGLGVPGWDEIDVAIDRRRRSVTLSVDGYPPRTAVHTGDQGCTLLPRGEDRIRFAPVKLDSSLPDAATQPWPTGDRPGEQPLPAEVNHEALALVLDGAFDNQQQTPPQNTRALLVTYQGRIIAERYAAGFDQQTRHICWSMGKSITAALIGILVYEGHFSMDDPAPIPAWHSPGDPRRKVTIRNLLQMSSGLRFGRGGPGSPLFLTSGDHHHGVYFGAVDVFDYSANRDLEFPPGTVWRYRNCDPLCLGKIVKQTVEAKGGEYMSFPHRALFDRIGMRNMVLECDPYGQFIMTGFDYGTARDWARFGLLHLQDGLWEGQRILPKGWIEQITTPAAADASQGYGGLFWLNRGKRYPSLPEDAYWAAGHHGQTTMIIPSREIVIVRLGHSAQGGSGPYIERIVSGILDAIGRP